ncbi:MAG: ATP-dependent DNA helicase RecG, partial [Pararhodobacter sp.]
MTGRPEALFPLFGTLEGLEGVGPKTAKLFKALQVETPRDLLFVLPHAGIDRRLRASVREITPPDVATVEVQIGNHLPPRQRGRPYRVLVCDSLQEFQLVFFHARGDYLQRLLPSGQRRVISGRVETFDGIYQMAHPDHVLSVEEAATLPQWEPVYPLTTGLTPRLMQKAMADALSRLPDPAEWIDPALKARMGWPDWKAALLAAHAPATGADLAPSAAPRQRLAYDELLAHQLTLAMARAHRRRAPGLSTAGDGRLVTRVLSALPYAPTGA